MDEEHEQVEGGTPTPEPVVKETHLRRSTKRRMVGGVAGGIAERFDIDANIVRVVFVVLTVLSGLRVALADLPHRPGDTLAALQRAPAHAPAIHRVGLLVIHDRPHPGVGRLSRVSRLYRSSNDGWQRSASHSAEF